LQNTGGRIFHLFSPAAERDLRGDTDGNAPRRLQHAEGLRGGSLGGDFSATNSLSVVSSNTFALQLAFTNPPATASSLSLSL
jgi:hypothetical protein